MSNRDMDFWDELVNPGEAHELAEWRNALPDPPANPSEIDAKFWLRDELEVLRTELFVQFGITTQLSHTGGGIVLLQVDLPGGAYAWFDKEHLLRGYHGDMAEAWTYRVCLYRDWEDEEGVCIPLYPSARASAELIGPWLLRLGADRTDPLTAYEIDNGPGGITWEIQRGSKWIATVATQEAAAGLGATVFHTLEQWYAEQAAEDLAEAVAQEARAAEVRERREGS